MSKIFFRPDGSASPHPPSKQEAIKLRRSQYDNGETCPDCQQCSIRYTINDRCKHCARLDAIDFFNTVIALRDWPEGKAVTDEMKKAYNSNPMADLTGHADNPQKAIQIGSPVWIRVEPCSKAGHLGVRVVNGGCWLCEQDKQQVSPRQQAIQAGERWYQPDEACPHCGTLSPRRVDNGQCQGCKPTAGGTAVSNQRSADRQLMADCPYLVISRADAKAAGMSVYRTGGACKRGHTGWRYVKGGACIDCQAQR